MSNQHDEGIASRGYLVYPQGTQTGTIEPTAIASQRELLEWVLQEVGPRALRDFVVTRLPNERLTTQQAAALLGMTRPTLIKMLDQGALPFSLVGNRRYIALADLEEYRVLRMTADPGEPLHNDDRVVRANLRALLRMAEEEGDYA